MSENSRETAPLRRIELPPFIETSETDFAEEFYNPVLKSAVEYKRGVGFFTSGWFEYVSAGMKELTKNDGVAKWIISPIIEEKDWKTLQKGEKAKYDEALYNSLEKNIRDVESGLEEDTLNTIAWMIADGLLEIKFAIPKGNLSGDFHDKWGIIEGVKGNKMAFHGSQNDSKKGFTDYDSFDIFCSWESEREAERVELHEARFDNMWHDNKDNVDIISLPQGIKENIVSLRRKKKRPYSKPDNSLWRHQLEGIEEFLDSENGILEMATGTGKTRVALEISDRLREKKEINGMIVSTKGKDLLGQWFEDLLDFFDPESLMIYKDYGSSRETSSFLDYNGDKFPILIIRYDNLQKLFDYSKENKLEDYFLICDEVHNIGSEKRRERLGGKLSKVKWRLGLSATPEREYGEEGNNFIEEEVGPVIFEFGIGDAIKRGILCEFEYEPLFYDLSEEDKEEKKNAFARFNYDKKEDPESARIRLYRRLARIRKKSEKKIPVFREYLSENPEVLENCLIFTFSRDYGHLVQKVIHDYKKDYHTYYGKDDKRNLRKFSNEDLSTLVTCKAISEGIDIKSIKNIILFSSDRSKLTNIQRIGRSLRRESSNSNKVAKVIDFVLREDLNNLGEDDWVPPDKKRYDWLSKLSQIKRVSDEY